MLIQCYKCKGKLLCGKRFCPISYNEMFKEVKELNDYLSSNSPPSVFVGSKFYPNLNVGILSPPEKVENAWVYDAQNYWANKNFSIDKIIFYRSNLVNSRFKANVLDVRKGSKFLEISQEVAMAYKPVGIEVELTKKIKMELNFDNINLPMGPRADLKRVKLTENPKIDDKVERVFYDTDLKSGEAIKYLHGKNFDEHAISKLLSIGALGLGKNRRLVPTRWSITATDDLIGKDLLNKIKNYNIINDYELFFGSYLGNYYLILLFPDVFSYELFEMYLPGALWNKNNKIQIATDYEYYNGRKSYANNTVGGYYASRLAVLEYLSNIKRQATVLILRFETPEYIMPLGVFVVRSAARKTLEDKCLKFSEREKMLNYAREFILKKFGYDINEVLKESKILSYIKKQVKLSRFL